MDFILVTKQYREAVGSFVIKFSQVEYGLAFLCRLSEEYLPTHEQYLPKYAAMPFERKIKTLSRFIDAKHSDLKSIWDTHAAELKRLNKLRRHLVHGHVVSGMGQVITTYIQEGGRLTAKEFTLEEIKAASNDLAIVSSGDNGINGEFRTTLTKATVDQWNSAAIDNSLKIVYRMNGEIISEWKG